LSGERDLERLLAGLAPELDPVEHGFETAPEAALPDGAFALIREREGVSRIGPGRGWARITLTVHSDLEAVGLTARVAAALAERGIAANVVAGLHHDHLFVPWARREEAVAALGALSAEAA
jgi:hypothetical protein